MQELKMKGGSSTATSRTATIIFYTKITLDSIKVPITLGTSTTAVKSAAVTVTVGSDTYSENTSYEKTETGDREIKCSIGRVIDAYTTVTVKFSGTRASVNYDTSTTAYGLGAQTVVKSNSFEATLYVDADKIWSASTINNGYAFITEVSVDESVFDGYDDPKPYNSWKIGTVNDGYAYTWGFSEITPTASQAYIKTADGLVAVTMWYKTASGLVPLMFAKVKE
jgi:hypothetical protein